MSNSNSKRVGKTTKSSTTTTKTVTRFTKSGTSINNAKVTQSNAFSAVVYDRNNVNNAMVFSTTLERNATQAQRDAVRRAFAKATGIGASNTNVCRLSYYASRIGSVKI